MLLRAMVREKLGSPRSSPKRSRFDEESKSPSRYETP
jgi:calcium/calmodulin-dependent protein kinase I